MNMTSSDLFADPNTRLMFSLFDDQENVWSQRPHKVSNTTTSSPFFSSSDDFAMSTGTTCCVSHASTVWHSNVASWYRPTTPLKSEHPPPSMNVAAIPRDRVVTRMQGNASNLFQASGESEKIHIPLTSTRAENMEDATSESSSGVTANSRHAIAAARILAKGKSPSSNIVSRLPHAHNLVDAWNATFLRLFVDDYSDATYWSLLDCINSNHVVEKIVIFRKREADGERTRTREDMDYLFRALGNLSRSLTKLHLWNFHPHDLPSLSLGLIDHPSISYLQLHMETGSLDETTTSALASMKKLVSLELEVNSSFPIGGLLRSESLVVLGMISDKFVFESKDILAMAEQLETNCVLQVLVLEPQIPSWCLSAILCSLNASTNSSLETFEFSCRTSTAQEGDNCMYEIINTLRNEDSRLRVMWNHSYESFEVSGGVQMQVLKILKANKVVEQFHVFVESHEFCATKCEVLERKMGAQPFE